MDEIPVIQRPGYGVIQAVEHVIATSMEDGSTVTGDSYSATLCLWSALHGLITLRAARPHVAWPPVEALIDALLTTQFVAQSALPQT